MREYFEYIKPVCPHSLESYDNNKLLTIDYDTQSIENQYQILDRYDAVLFKCHPSTSREELMSIVQDLNDERPNAMWFWSHPVDQHYSTPMPSIIMQNKETLQKARKEYKMKLQEMDHG
jgi:hypothetical protein